MDIALIFLGSLCLSDALADALCGDLGYYWQAQVSFAATAVVIGFVA